MPSKKKKKDHAFMLGVDTERLAGKTIKEVRITKELGDSCIVFEDGCLLELQEQDRFDYHDCNRWAMALRFWTKEDRDAMVDHGWVNKWWEAVYEEVL